MADEATAARKSVENAVRNNINYGHFTKIGNAVVNLDQVLCIGAEEDGLVEIQFVNGTRVLAGANINEIAEELC
jgi:hypothetical protein